MALVTFPEAVRRAVKAFYEGSSFESYEKTTKKPLKYNHSVFDEMQSTYKRKAKRAKKKSEMSQEDEEMEDED
jgi:hypothetical protein